MIRCLHFSYFLTADFLFRFLLFSPTRSLLLLLQLILRRWHPYYHTTATFWSHFFSFLIPVSHIFAAKPHIL